MNEYLYELAKLQYGRFAEVKASTAAPNEVIPPWHELDYDTQRAWALSLKPAFTAAFQQGGLLEVVNKSALLQELANRSGVEMEWKGGVTTITVMDGE